MRWGIFSVTLAGHGMFIDWKLIFFVLGNKRAIEECSKFPCTETGLQGTVDWAENPAEQIILSQQLMKAFKNKKGQKNLHWQKESQQLFSLQNMYFSLLFTYADQKTQKENSGQVECSVDTVRILRVKTKQLLLVVIEGVAFIMDRGNVFLVKPNSEKLWRQ